MHVAIHCNTTMRELLAALAVLCLALTVTAQSCRDRISQCDIEEPKSGSLSYNIPGIVNINCTAGEMVRCNQTIVPGFLSGRTWYLTQDKAYYGQGYNTWHFQTYNIQCPHNQFLYLRPIVVDMECNQIETLTLNTSRYNGPICTDNERSAVFGSTGLFLMSGQADVDFCSNDNITAEGFVMRATCIDMFTAYNAPGCVSYPYWIQWDPLFTLSISDMFNMVQTTVVPHKRSAEEEAEMYKNMRNELSKLSSFKKKADEEIAQLKRAKRGVEREKFAFSQGTTVTFINGVLEFTFPNGSIRRVNNVACLAAFNNLYGTRSYCGNATRQIGDRTGSTGIIFTGPGTLDAIPSKGRKIGYLIWTTQPFEQFWEEDFNTDQIQIADRIYEYIYRQWLAPYPVIDPLADDNAFPLFGATADDFSFGIRRRNQIDAIHPQIQKNGQCRATIRLDVAPLQTAAIDIRLLSFCSFFQHACDPILRTACQEIMLLDPYDTDPLTLMMMGGGRDR